MSDFDPVLTLDSAQTLNGETQVLFTYTDKDGTPKVEYLEYCDTDNFSIPKGALTLSQVSAIKQELASTEDAA